MIKSKKITVLKEEAQKIMKYIDMYYKFLKEDDANIECTSKDISTNNLVVDAITNEIKRLEEEIKGEVKMKDINEVRDYLVKHRTDRSGDLDLSNLDFRDFDGNIFINSMRVKNDLNQSNQVVKGDLLQMRQKVDKGLYQDFQKVGGSLFQDEQIVDKDLYQGFQKVGGRLFQNEKSKLLIKTIKELTKLDYEQLQDVLNSIERESE